jgi:hypothetical protein
MPRAPTQRSRGKPRVAPVDGALPPALQRLPCTPPAHRRLWQLAAVAHVLARLARDAGSFEAVFQQHPFLQLYGEELLALGLNGVPAGEAKAMLCRHLLRWQQAAAVHLPLAALVAAHGLDDDALLLLLTAALPEEDARFGALFEQLNGQSGARRLGAGLAAAWWSTDERGPLLVNRLLGAGLLRTPDVQSPRADWPLVVPPALWQVLRGVDDAAELALPAWLRWHPASAGVPLASLVLDDALRATALSALGLLREGGAPALVLRSPPGNGRHALLGALAAEAGFGVAEATALPDSAERWDEWAALCVALRAWPLLVLQPAPGQSVALRPWRSRCGPLLVVLERSGSVAGDGVAGALHLDLPLPDPHERERHWRAALQGQPEADAAVARDLATAFRIGRGQLHRSARQLPMQRRLVQGTHASGPTAPWRESVAATLLPEQRGALEPVAVLLPPAPSWQALVVPESTLDELKNLELRCRWRERLPGTTARPAAGCTEPPSVKGLLLDAPCGVRALFSGASGTGKTLAARVLATALGKPVFRMDLSAIVDKYIGETEKNLERTLARAEQQDVVLLLDEGDALLARRTAVAMPTTATPISKPASCCSGWNRSKASLSSPATLPTASIRPSPAAWTPTSCSRRPPPSSVWPSGSAICRRSMRSTSRSCGTWPGAAS